jgi:hypothetical protein
MHTYYYCEQDIYFAIAILYIYKYTTEQDNIAITVCSYILKEINSNTSRCMGYLD